MLKKLITIIWLILMGFPSIGQCPEITGEELFRVDQIFRLKDLPYGTEVSETRQMLDLYFPAPLQDCPKAKLIVIIHGGGFEGGNKNQLKGWGYHFARRGFYVALINYRLLMNAHQDMAELMLNKFLYVGGKQCQKLNDINFRDGVYKIDKAWYFAVQDSRAALSYIQHNLEERGKKLDKIYVIGESAGAISAMGLVWGQQEDFNALNPLLESQYGSIDSRVKFRPAEKKNIDAVVSISGGLINAEQFLTKQDSVPMIFFHGGEDPGFALCKDRCFYNERRVNGPLRIKELVDSLQIPLNIEAHFWAGEGHHLIGEYEKISEILSKRFSDKEGPTKIKNSLQLYPPNALMFNCAIVAFREDIKAINRFVSEDFVNSGVSLYPNPNDGNFTLVIPGDNSTSVHIEMYDATGKLVLQDDFISRTSEKKISAGHLNAGMYELLIVQNAYKAEKIRLIVH